jgi:hypothetical protein
MKEYSKRDLDQLAELSLSYIDENQEENPEENQADMSEADLEQLLKSGFNADQLDELFQGTETLAQIEAQLEEAYIIRSISGRSAMRLHRASTSKRIFW